MLANAPKPVLGSLDIVALIVGTIVGAGIYKTPALVAGLVPNESAIIALWILGGVISIIGALCYAELASAFPDTGGEYHFLSLAWGRRTGFFYAWSRTVVIMPGSIAMLSITFGDYVSPLLPLGTESAYLWAVILVLAASVVNWLGIRLASGIQKAFFFLALTAVIAIIIAGMMAGGLDQPSVVGAEVMESSGGADYSLGLAMVFVMLAYGGWNEAAYISAEARDQRKGVLWGLGIGLVAITLLYVGVNVAFMLGLGRTALATTSVPVTDLFSNVIGASAGIVAALIVALSCMKSVNATVFFGARSSFALGRDWHVLGWLNGWHASGAPRQAILVQLAISLVLIAVARITRSGFAAVVEFTAPVFWTFILLVALSLIKLRHTQSEVERPFRVPFYPALPVIFATAAGWMLWSSLNYTGLGAIVGVAFLLAGVVPLAIEEWKFPNREV